MNILKLVKESIINKLYKTNYEQALQFYFGYKVAVLVKLN